MAISNLAVRFTEEKYASKTEVAKELKIHYVDNIWSNILSYRANFNRYLSLYTIENKNYVFCYSNTISEKVNRLNSKLSTLTREFSRIGKDSNDHNHVRSYHLIKCLRSLAKDLDLDVTQEYLTSMIRGDLRTVSSSHQILKNYLNALNYIENNYINPTNEDFLANLYSKVLGNDELTSFYRTLEDKAPENRVIIDRVYTAAPVKLIPLLMNGLYEFIKNSNLSAAVKSLVAYYYINYVKPFPKYNDEIAVLFAKAIISNIDLGEYGVLLPLEKLLSEDVERLTQISYEVKKTSDITYFVNYGSDLILKIIDEISDYIADLNRDILKNDFYKEDGAQEVKTVVEPKPVVKTTEEQPKTTEAPVLTETKVVEPIPVQEERIAVSYIPKAIDEKEAYRLQQHLLELDPSLKKGEAKFYARHCTLGKKYTIAQYKKYNGCAYETARTSMDHLAELGYYRKEQVKNKYVYAPIPRQ